MSEMRNECNELNRGTGSRRVSVRLTAKDWGDLAHFVVGDLDNMPDDDPVCKQMRRICNTIQRGVIRSENTD